MIAHSSVDSSWTRSRASFVAPQVLPPHAGIPTQCFPADVPGFHAAAPALPELPGASFEAMAMAMDRLRPLDPAASLRPLEPAASLRPSQALLSYSAAGEGLLADAGETSTVRQYLLVCHARTLSITEGIWCFSLESLSGEPILDVECEEEGDLNRLSLLAAVRGLESIDGRGAVSLISNNRYLIRSLDRALPRWRENDFVWEQFGRKMPVQNADLWRRIDRTLAIHSVTASLLQSTRVSTGSVQPHAPFSPGLFAVDDAEPTSTTLRFDRPHAAPQAGPSDGLRRWLAGNCDAAPIVTRRGRYRAADIAGG